MPTAKQPNAADACDMPEGEAESTVVSFGPASSTLTFGASAILGRSITVHVDAKPRPTVSDWLAQAADTTQPATKRLYAAQHAAWS